MPEFSERPQGYDTMYGLDDDFGAPRALIRIPPPTPPPPPPPPVTKADWFGIPYSVWMTLGAVLTISLTAEVVLRRGNRNKRHYTLAELQALPTISQAHFANLKIDDGKERIWLSRMTVADGAPYENQVSVEALQAGNWVTVEQYQAVASNQAGNRPTNGWGW